MGRAGVPPPASSFHEPDVGGQFGPRFLDRVQLAGVAERDSCDAPLTTDPAQAPKQQAPVELAPGVSEADPRVALSFELATVD